MSETKVKWKGGKNSWVWKCKARGQTENEGLHCRIRRVLGHQTHRPCPGSPYSKEAPHADTGLETGNGNVKGMSSSEHEHKMYNSKTPLRESSKVINDQDRKLSLSPVISFSWRPAQARDPPTVTSCLSFFFFFLCSFNISISFWTVDE